MIAIHESQPVFFAAICFVSTLFLSLCTGVRLLWVARRTRGFPERVVGAACTVLALAGLCDVAVGCTATPGAKWVAAIAGHTGYSVAAALLLVSTLRIFRDRQAWAVWCAYAGAAGLGVVSLVVVIAGPHLHADGRVAPGLAGSAYLAGLVLRLCAYGWLACEALVAYGAGRRALRFGLADPLVVHQFLLWALSALAMGGGVLGALYARSQHGYSVSASASGLYLFSALGLVGAGAAWLAFFPPRSYARSVVDGAPSHGG